MNTRIIVFAVYLLAPCASIWAATVPVETAPRLFVSQNHRFLVKEDGKPFFYLADTAWELFHRLNREEADVYLEDRARKGFTVIQAVAIAELDGHVDPNPYGFLPLVDLDPARPAERAGPNNDYWDHVDYIVNKAQSLGMVIGFLPTWGRYWHDEVNKGKPLFNSTNAAAYGEWLGRRYKDRPSIIWILGGDRLVQNKTHSAIIDAMAEGLRAGDGGAHLITFHAPGGSSEWFHNKAWLDFNMRESGHDVGYSSYLVDIGIRTKGYTGFSRDIWSREQTLVDYQRLPPKPVIDGEPVYEDHPVAFMQAELGHTIAADVRRPLYWDLFNGACGHTYGHHSIWQMYRPGKKPVNDPLTFWDEALSAPGSGQMQYARWLMESRPFLTRVPDPGLLVERAPASAWPGAGVYRFVSTRDESGSYAMVYAPVGRKFTVRTGALSGKTLRAWWYDPRSGAARLLGEFAKTDQREFMSPNPGEFIDWILVLDDASKGYSTPGIRSRQ